MGARSWRRTLEHGAGVVAAFILLLQGAATLSALTGAREAPLAVVAGIALLLGSQVTLAALCVVGTRSTRWTTRWTTRACTPGLVAVGVAVGCLGVVGAGSLHADSPVPPFALQLLPINAVQALQVVSLVLVVPAGKALALVAATGPLYLVVRTATAGVDLAAAVDEWVLPAAMTSSILLVLAHLRREAAYADAVADRARVQAHAVRAGANRELAADETRRLVHDEVVSALRCVELRLDPADVERACDSALRVLGGLDHVDGTRRLPEWLRSETPLALEMHDAGWPLDPPPRVTFALGAAAAEAVRNVHRHAGVEAAEITLADDDGRCLLEVRDRGCGIAEHVRPGFGIRESVLARTAAVGGSAEVLPAAGGGTLVRLVWPAVPERPAHARDAPGIVRDRRRVNLLVAVPAVLANTYLALRYPGEVPALTMLVLVALAGVALAAAAVLARPPTPGRLAAVVTACWALVVAGVVAQPPGAMLSLDSWVVGLAGAPLALVAFHGGPRWALAAAVGTGSVVLALAALDPVLAPTDPVGALGTPLLVIGIGTLFGRLLGSAGAAIARAENALTAQTEERAWHEGLAAARRSHLAHVEREVVPFLRRVRDEGTSCESAELARLLGEQCRDDLVLATPMPDAARRSVRAARGRGVTVTLQAGERGGELPAATWPVVQAAVVRAGPRHHVTVLPSRGTRPARVVAIPPLDLPAEVARHGTVVAAPSRTVVLVAPDGPDGPARGPSHADRPADRSVDRAADRVAP